MLTLQNLYELNVDRQVLMEKTDFRSTFRVEKQNPLEYKTTYDASFSNGQKDVFRETKSLMKTKQSSAGAYDQFKNDSIGLITTLYCEQNRNGRLRVTQTLTQNTIQLCREAGSLPKISLFSTGAARLQMSSLLGHPNPMTSRQAPM